MAQAILAQGSKEYTFICYYITPHPAAAQGHLSSPDDTKNVQPRASVFLNGPREGHRSREAPRTKNEKTCTNPKGYPKR